jgi:methyltransferase (TIGR00027 family)
MTDPTSTVRGISDTARWVAYFRARETKRPDALFRDPYAERLAGEHGFKIANTLPDGNKHEWAWVARTYLFDQFLSRAIQNGADLVVNLAAGLDARPYRMNLPSTLQWVEVDLPDIVSYKDEILGKEKPRCRLERISLDLSDAPGRRQLFSEIDARAKKIVVASEGLLIYFATEDVARQRSRRRQTLSELDNRFGLSGSTPTDAAYQRKATERGGGSFQVWTAGGCQLFHATWLGA